jgi:hypothetical protein
MHRNFQDYMMRNKMLQTLMLGGRFFVLGVVLARLGWVFNYASKLPWPVVELGGLLLLFLLLGLVGER